MISPDARDRERDHPRPRRKIEPWEGYQPSEAMSPEALANPPRGGSNIRPPATPKK